ncbi:MAG: hypothetical protein ACO1OG_06035 [Devosia sp.]
MKRALAALLLLAATPASAVDVTFTGNIDGLCLLSLPTNGSLSVDGEGWLSSGLLGFGTITVLSVGDNELDVTVPEWVTTPSGYDPLNEEFELGYDGLAGLSFASRAFAPDPAEIDIPTLPLTILRLHARAFNDNGFADGLYRMKVMVTCS